MKIEDRNPNAQTKKAYHTPVIHYYGDIRTITQSTNVGTVIADGMPGSGMTKT